MEGRVGRLLELGHRGLINQKERLSLLKVSIRQAEVEVAGAG